MIQVKRAYEKPAESDGVRILVERIWPRGLTKQEAAIDEWMEEIAPSTQLRQWFGHDPAKWDEFQRRYKEELAENTGLVEALREKAKKGAVTLIYSARDQEHNSALVLKNMLDG